MESGKEHRESRTLDHIFIYQRFIMSRKSHAASSDTLVSDEVASLLRTIDGQLYLLGWSRQHPRVIGFINAINKKHTFLNLLGLEGVPPKYLKRLIEFLQIYSQCEQLIKKFRWDWDNPTITELTRDYGGHNKMSLRGWKHLYESLENEYFLTDMPTSNKSTTKTNVKQSRNTCNHA